MIVIHHNPGCGTSRNVLSIIEASGETPVIIDYLKEGWTRPQLLALFAAAGLTPRTAPPVAAERVSRTSKAASMIWASSVMSVMGFHFPDAG